MPKKCDVARRAWNVLRLALLWARKGGVFKRRLMSDLPKYIRSLGHSTPRDQLRYGERQLSFDKTPIFHFKMHRPDSMRFHMPRIPCINPQVDFDYDFDMNGDDEDGIRRFDDGRQSFLKNGEEEEYGCADSEEMIPCEEEGIDLRAEEFIAKFYQQLKLQ